MPRLTKRQIERTLGEMRRSNASEAKHVAAFVRDVLDDGGGPALVAASMDELIGWALFVKNGGRKVRPEEMPK